MTKTKTRKELKSEMLDAASITEDGLSYQEISKILNIPIHVVKRIEIDALRKLQAPTEKNKTLHKYWNIGEKPDDRINI